MSILPQINAHDRGVEDTHALPREGDYLEVCIAPPLHMQFMTAPEYMSRKIAFHNYWLKRWRNNVRGLSDYRLCLEISRGSLLHYHGILKISDAEQFYGSLAQIRYGTLRRKRDVTIADEEVRLQIYNIKDRKHLEERIEYCTKDHYKMEYEITDKNGTDIR